MISFYLITGFLGAGKTTFLKNMMRAFGGKKLSIIVNEFGKEGVDGKLLSDIGVSLSEITGGSIFCTCRLDQFESALNRVAEEGPEVLIVEASGLSDPTSIRKLLSGERWSRQVAYCGCICLADAVNLPKIYQTARVCKKQLSICDMVLINKTDLATEEQLKATRDIISAQRPDAVLYETSFGRVESNWLETLSGQKEGTSNTFHTADVNLHSLSVTVSEDFTPYDFTKFLEMIAEDTYRIKGFVRLLGKVYLADCVGSLVKVQEYTETAEVTNRVTILYGYGLPALKSAENAAKWYLGKVRIEC